MWTKWALVDHTPLKLTHAIFLSGSTISVGLDLKSTEIDAHSGFQKWDVKWVEVIEQATA